MSGNCWCRSAGARSVRQDKRGSATRRRSANGVATNGRPLKKAEKEGRTIVFIDESGISQRPHRCRMWAPRGQTPVLQHCFNWKSMSAIAGLSFSGFHFQLYAGSIKSPQVADFLICLRRHIPNPLLIVWDRLPAHRSKLVTEYVDSQNGMIEIDYLPAYAPELNPVEYIWAYWKQHELPNFCPSEYWQLGETARKSLRKMRRRKRLVPSFWKQASLWPE